MPDEQPLQAEAKKIKQNLGKKGEDEVDLNQPFPDDLPDSANPKKVVAEEAAKIVVESEVTQKSNASEPDQSSDKEPEKPKENTASGDADSPNEDNEDKSNESNGVAGYSATDIVKSPVKPPNPDTSEGKQATSNRKVKLLVALGTGLAVLGVICLFLSVLLGIFLLLLGGAAIVVSVFLPIGSKKSSSKKKDSDS